MTPIPRRAALIRSQVAATVGRTADRRARQCGQRAIAGGSVDLRAALGRRSYRDLARRLSAAADEGREHRRQRLLCRTGLESVCGEGGFVVTARVVPGGVVLNLSDGVGLVLPETTAADQEWLVRGAGSGRLRLCGQRECQSRQELTFDGPTSMRVVASRRPAILLAEP